MALNDIGKQTIDNMIRGRLLPESSLFDITERLLYEYLIIYNHNCKGSFGKSSAKFDRLYTRKMAGLTLLNLKKDRGGSARNCKEGFIYFVTNPAWPQHTKVGLAFDVKSRLSTYQTYDPFKAYKIESYEFVTNRREFEKIILNEYQVNPERGEWIPHTKFLKMVRNLRGRIISSIPEYSNLHV